jgi:hypothetical protein
VAWLDAAHSTPESYPLTEKIGFLESMWSLSNIDSAVRFRPSCAFSLAGGVESKGNSCQKDHISLLS